MCLTHIDQEPMILSLLIEWALFLSSHTFINTTETVEKNTLGYDARCQYIPIRSASASCLRWLHTQAYSFFVFC